MSGPGRVLSVPSGRSGFWSTGEGGVEMKLSKLAVGGPEHDRLLLFVVADGAKRAGRSGAVFWLSLVALEMSAARALTGSSMLIGHVNCVNA